MARQVAAWLQRADAVVAVVVGAGILLLHWDAFRENFGVGAPPPLVTAAALAVVAWAALLATLAPSRVAAVVTAASAAVAAYPLVSIDRPDTTLGRLALAVFVGQLVLSAVTEAAIAGFAIRSNPTRTRG